MKTDWIQTYTGRKVYPLELTPDQVCIEDIAHALSLKCRFTGHCREFYSVADHSLRVAALLEPSVAIYGLLHDAAEAYLPDVAAPIKGEFMVRHGAKWFNPIPAPQLKNGCEISMGYTPTFKEVENAVLRTILEAFNGGFELIPRAVGHADLVLLATEARDLMGPPPAPWNLDVPLLPEKIEPLSPTEAESRFLSRFHQLTGL